MEATTLAYWPQLWRMRTSADKMKEASVPQDDTNRWPTLFTSWTVTVGRTLEL